MRTTIFEPRRRALVALLLAAAACRRDAPTEHGGDNAQDQNPSRELVTRNDRGEAVLHLDQAAQLRLGIVVAPFTASARSSEITAFGRIVDDPDRMSTIRAPLAGVLRADDKTPWPTRGTRIEAGRALGWIEPRLTAVARADLASRIGAAQGDARAAHASLVASTAALERARQLNASDKTVSDRAVEEAGARVSTDEARESSARSTISVLESLLSPGAERSAAVQVMSASAGEVVETLSHVGEFVDAGAVLARIADFDEILTRVELPLDADLDPSFANARIVRGDNDSQALAASSWTFDPRADGATASRSILFVVPRPSSMDVATWRALGLRPGQVVKALLASKSADIQGFSLPATAVVHHAGKTWIYVVTGADELTRKPVSTLGSDGSAITRADWARDARAVTVGAQALLSAEIFATDPSAAGDEE